MQAPSAKNRSRDPQQYDEEYQALQASLEDYLRQQVSLLSDPRGAAGTAAAPALQEGGFRRYRADVYFVVTLALIGFLWWQTRTPAPNGTSATPAAVTSPAGGDASAPPGPPPARAAGTSPLPQPPPEMSDPGAWWSGYVADHRVRVADWLVAISQASGVAADQVSERQKLNFEAWADKVAAGTASSGELTNCRIGLFELVYGRWIQDAGNVASQWGKVDLVVNPAEYAAEDVSLLLAELGRDHWFDSVDPADAQLQIAVILAWLETHQP